LRKYRLDRACGARQENDDFVRPHLDPAVQFDEDPFPPDYRSANSEEIERRAKRALASLNEAEALCILGFSQHAKSIPFFGEPTERKFGGINTGTTQFRRV
jgi:hypothetical protein